MWKCEKSEKEQNLSTMWTFSKLKINNERGVNSKKIVVLNKFVKMWKCEKTKFINKKNI